jgi:nitrogen fixation protein NifZ
MSKVFSMGESRSPFVPLSNNTMKPDRFDKGRLEFCGKFRGTRNIRNAGTYQGMDVGVLLTRRRSVGNNLNVGTFLQEQVVNTVYFLNVDRIETLFVGDGPWNPGFFGFRDKVAANIDSGVQGNILFPKCTDGEVFKKLRDSEKTQYHVAFQRRNLLAPESALSPAHPESSHEPKN